MRVVIIIIIIIIIIYSCTSLSQFLGAFAKFLKTTLSFVMYVCLSVRLYVWNKSIPTGHIFLKFGIWIIFENLWRN